jgi:hypothetical protein
MRAILRDALWFVASGALGSLLVASGALLLGAADDGTRLGPPESVGEVERSAALGVAALGLLVLCWWALGLIAAFAACLLSSGGRPDAARRIARISPAFMRRLAAATIGANLLLAPPAQATVAAPHVGVATAATDFASQAPAPYWTPASGDEAATQVGTARAEGATRRVAPDPGWTAEQPAAPMDRVIGGSGRTGTNRDVVVTRGDSLWSIAARSLGPQATEADIAREWPRWYGANRHSIGSDPDHLDVGTVLVPPTG